MDKKIKILIAGAGVAQVNSIYSLMNSGYYVITLDGDKNAPGLEIADCFEVCDIRNDSEIVKFAKKHKVDAITSFCTDVPVLPIARACEYLGLRGLDPIFAEFSVNKKLQRALLKKNNIPVPDFATFRSSREARKILEGFEGHIVIKPIDSSGSKGVKYFEDFSSIDNLYLDHVINLSTNGEGIIESFIEGEEIAIDGFVIDGAVEILSICSKKRTKPPHLLDTELRFPSSIDQEQIKEVKLLIDRISSISKMNNTPFHIEMINSDKGPMLVELAARGAGFNVFDKIVSHVSGIDTIDIQTKLSLGETPTIPHIAQNAGILYFISSSFEGIIKKMSNRDDLLSIDGVKEVQFYSGPGDKVYPLRSGQDRLGYILCLSDSIEECELALKQAKQELVLEINK